MYFSNFLSRLANSLRFSTPTHFGVASPQLPARLSGRALDSSFAQKKRISGSISGSMMQNRLRRPRAEINVKPFTAYLYKIGPVGLEPTTYGLEIRCSIQLSYEPDTCLQKAVIIVPRFYRQAACLQSYEFEQMIECYQFDSFS